MDRKAIDILLGEVTSPQFSESLHPFPSADCRRLLPEDNRYFTDFISALDIYFIDVAGYYNTRYALGRSSKEKLLKARRLLASSFFDRYSQFKVLEGQINNSQTPQLFSRLSGYEKLRQALLSLIAALLVESGDEVDSDSL